MKSILGKLYYHMDNSRSLQCIRNGLIKIIPILLIGSFALVLQSLPIPPYQTFIHDFADGIFYFLFTAVYNATFGLMAIYITISVSICYTQQSLNKMKFNYGPMFASIVSFGICSGILSKSFTIDAFGVKGMFTAILCAIIASYLYCIFASKMPSYGKLYTDGADIQFNEAISTLIPILFTVAVFALLNFILNKIFDVNGFQELFINSTNYIFANLGRNIFTALLYVFLSSLLWFFGVHGSDVLEGVSQHLFQDAPGILNKSFFDTFVLMGGCGTSMCLLIALLLFSKRRSNHNLAKFAVFPMCFNISELMVFGLPVVFNPLLLIPFLITPLVMVLTTYLAMSTGLVPAPVSGFEWTTPILFSGYLATKSFSAVLLQIINLIIGVFIYKPFVKLYDGEKVRNASIRMAELTKLLMESEDSGIPIAILELHSSSGSTARNLAVDLEYSITHKNPAMQYQPQYDYNDKCIGVEALIRWNHPLYGNIYPPLIFKVAEEYGCLEKMEEAVFNSVLADMDKLIKILGPKAKISANVTGTTIQTSEFEAYLTKFAMDNPDIVSHICIEITEQASFSFTPEFIARLNRIHSLGFEMAIDDFSMGNTSVKYLQNNIFDLVKLDGSLVRDVLNNKRSLEIISSIADLSKRFGISVLAEYVENNEQKEVLHEIGCAYFQGYLYSPAISLKKLESFINS